MVYMRFVVTLVSGENVTSLLRNLMELLSEQDYSFFVLTLSSMFAAWIDQATLKVVQITEV